MSIEHPVLMSEDGEDIFICLTFRQDNPLSQNVEGQDSYTDFVMIATISLHDLDFTLPFPKFALSRGEDVHQFIPGPIIEETLTRVVFVCSSFLPFFLSSFLHFFISSFTSSHCTAQV